MTLRPYQPFFWLEEGWRVLRFAIRSFARTPGFTSIALLVIAAGIGVNTAVFSGQDMVPVSIGEFGRTGSLKSVYTRLRDQTMLQNRPDDASSHTPGFVAVSVFKV